MPDALRREDQGPTPAADWGLGVGDGDQRAAARFTILIRAAKLITPQGEFLGVIRDASESGISMRIFHELTNCLETTIELQNGDRYLANLRWQNAERAGFQFKSPADIDRIIESPSRFSKRAIRLNVIAEADLCGGLQVADCMIQDLSQQGAKISCNSRFAIDERVRLKADGMREINAKVRWRRGESYGLIFEETFQFGELARIACQLQSAD